MRLLLKLYRVLLVSIFFPFLIIWALLFRSLYGWDELMKDFEDKA